MKFQKLITSTLAAPNIGVVPLASLVLLSAVLMLVSIAGPLASASSAPSTDSAKASSSARTAATDATGSGLTTWDVRDFGAKCDNVTDDEPAFAAAFNATKAFYADGGRKATLHIAAGTCFLNSGTLPPFYIPSGRGGAGLAIIGDGPHQTTIRLGAGYSGDVLSLSEAWNRAYYKNPFSPTSDFSGVTLQGFSIVGDNTVSNAQNGIVFYDRNDFVSIRDVDVRFLNGRCISVGATLNTDQAYMCESNIDNVHCWHTGPHNAATFEISSTTTNTSDASNEIDIHALNILGSAGPCFEISNPLNHSASRQIKIFDLRVESCGSDQIVIQDVRDAGTVANIQFFGLESIGSPSGSTSFKINAGRHPYNINVFGGYIYSSTGAGIDIEGGNSVNIQIGALVTAQTSITTGSAINGPVTISPIVSSYTFKIDPRTASWVTLGRGSVPFSLDGSATAGRFYGPALATKPVNEPSQRDRLYATPVYINHPSLLKTLSFRIGTGNAAIWHAEMCVYADNGEGKPGPLVPLADTGRITIPAGTTGVRTAAVNGGTGVQLVGPGWYWLAFNADSAAASLDSIAAGPHHLDGLYATALLGAPSAEAIFDATATTGMYISQPFGACRSIFGIATFSNDTATPYLVMGY